MGSNASPGAVAVAPTPAVPRKRGRELLRRLSVLQAGLFTGFIVALAALAGLRAAGFATPEEARLADGALARAFETHYDAVFPVKTLGTNLWAALDYVVFDEGRPGVVLGRHEWLYSEEEFETYRDAPQQVAIHLGMLARVRDALALRGTSLVVAPIPAKTRIYPEHLGKRQPAALHASLYARLQAALRDAGIAAPDLARTLRRCKRDEPTYLRTDTHWTPHGARCAAASVARVLADGRLLTRDPHAYLTRLDPAQPVRGDLLRFLPLDPYFARLLPPPDVIALEHTELPGAGGDAADLLGEAPVPKVTLIGTSYSADTRWNFAGALQQALGEDVANFAQPAKGPFVPMLEYLDSREFASAPPRVVIWELPERYLPMADDASALRTHTLPNAVHTSITNDDAALRRARRSRYHDV